MVLYLGDGRSAANLLGTDAFEKLVGKLTDAHISVSSFAVGLRTDPQLLGALAAQTGGIVISDEDLAGKEAGGQLAALVDSTVLWPNTVTWPAEMTEVFPKRMTPLRSDRDTVVIGTLKGKGPLNVKIAAAGTHRSPTSRLRRDSNRLG